MTRPPQVAGRPAAVAGLSLACQAQHHPIAHTRRNVASGGPDQVHITGRLNRLLIQAEDEAKQFKDDYVSVEHLLLATTESGGPVGRIFKDKGITRERLMAGLREVRGNQRVTSQNPEATYQALERFGIELTATRAGRSWTAPGC